MVMVNGYASTHELWTTNYGPRTLDHVTKSGQLKFQFKFDVMNNR